MNKSVYACMDEFCCPLYDNFTHITFNCLTVFYILHLSSLSGTSVKDIALSY